ncbi:hypothetical protein NDU88_000995 [Pleurodeles waltl]|uniref:Uncharacterized protein n=1 Tax=Pleurodeles waltl TaxID=8319 RepID=A0AAV7UUS3_PLEWA|nr:hypothetical protein NDU88_000995 [Pleurodeles waltl]
MGDRKNAWKLGGGMRSSSGRKTLYRHIMRDKQHLTSFLDFAAGSLRHGQSHLVGDWFDAIVPKGGANAEKVPICKSRRAHQPGDSVIWPRLGARRRALKYSYVLFCM